ncbi:hypothetical protein DFP72DRAFT_1162351 [Ephemerocybe angulata]|uniref:F-box domain-containing protein n=1 Tax=Ephemerocybe angulata TaxID=980116 RepID=A0A8H6IGT8_9AGAR|nr:hypothetical protein DFP72DRAFT_1162351 [Tulosesus angulatus]
MDQDRFAHLFTGNFMLNALELESVRHEIEARTTSIHQLELQIGVLKAEREKYQTLLSPLRRNLLPTEILGEIFSFSTQFVAESNSSASYQLNTLCRVCKAWRAAALVKPALWATVGWLCVDAPENLDVGKVGVWLSRSGKVKKSLRIVGDHGAEGSAACPLSPSELRSLLVEGPPLDDFSLSCTYAECLEAVFSGIQSSSTKSQSCDSMSSLHLEMEWASSMSFGRVCHILDRFPTLRTLSLTLPDYYDFVQENQLPESLPFGNLTTLSLAYDWPGALVLGILRNCAGLETLSLDTRGSLRSNNTSYPHNLSILLPKVRTLQLKEVDLSSRATDILRHLRVPSLHTLDIGFYTLDRFDLDDYDMTNISSDIASLIDDGPNRTTNLQHLRFESLAITSQGLYSILSALPTLTHLTLEKLESDSRLFRIVQTLGTKKLLPQLKTFEMHGASELFKFNYADVYDFLNRRKEGVTEESPDYLEEAVLTVPKERTYLWRDGFEFPSYHTSEIAKKGVRLTIAAV